MPDVSDLVGRLTREEKLSLVRGARDPEGTATGYLPGVERVGVPEFRMVDGPLGVRIPEQRATAFPAALALAATFDPSLAGEQGAATAREARALGQDALLAPGMNLVRVPHCGRNFEYFSEDPLLSARFAAATVEGIQSEGVVATAKHFVANNQESGRTTVSAEVDERTLRELYLPSFEAAVDAGVGSVMTAYNRVNGTHTSDHRWLLRDVLKGEWGFEGYVVSDWHGIETTVGAANAGLDVEMPGVPMTEVVDAVEMADLNFDSERLDGVPDGRKAGLFGEPLAEAIDAGEVPPERLDDMVRRVLGQLARFGHLDGVGERERDSVHRSVVDSPEHRELAERAAAQAMVLLENDGLLPLPEDADVAVIGPNVDEAKLGGGGSAETTPFRSVSPAEGLTARAGGEVTVLRGAPRIPHRSLFDRLPLGDDSTPREWETGEAQGRNGGTDQGDDAVESDRPSLDDAVEAAREADAAVVFVRDATTEGRDRDDLRLPGEQDELVESVAAANENTAVVVRSGGPVELPWRQKVSAVLQAWYPGQADGEAVASVLYGDRDPGGRLPITFAPEGSYPTADERRYPGVDDRAHYEEGVFVGYRHFDAADAEPTYPFGYGRSYATFDYGDAEATGERSVRVTVENVSERDGREVVQAYVRPPTAPGDVERPVRELAGFESVEIPAGESRAVDLDLDELAFSRYDPEAGWTVDPGTYVVEVGRSSRDARSTVELRR